MQHLQTRFQLIQSPKGCSGHSQFRSSILRGIDNTRLLHIATMIDRHFASNSSFHNLLKFNLDEMVETIYFTLKNQKHFSNSFWHDLVLDGLITTTKIEDCTFSYLILLQLASREREREEGLKRKAAFILRARLISKLSHSDQKSREIMIVSEWRGITYRLPAFKIEIITSKRRREKD